VKLVAFIVYTNFYLILDINYNICDQLRIIHNAYDEFIPIIHDWTNFFEIDIIN